MKGKLKNETKEHAGAEESKSSLFNNSFDKDASSRASEAAIALCEALKQVE